MADPVTAPSRVSAPGGPEGTPPDNDAQAPTVAAGSTANARRKRRTTDLAAFRLRIALLMAAISLLSAYVTHIATGLGSDASDLYGLASQQSAEEEQTEQHIDGIVAQEQRLTALISTFWDDYAANLEAAGAARATDPARAAAFDLDAQASYEVIRQLWPFYRTALPTNQDSVLTYDVDAAKNALRVADFRLYRASSAVTRQEAVATAGATSGAVLVVVALVGSLLLLTAAHLYPGRRGFYLAVAGLIVAATATAAQIVIAPTAAVPVISAAVGLIIIGVGLRISDPADAVQGCRVDRGGAEPR